MPACVRSNGRTAAGAVVDEGDKRVASAIAELKCGDWQRWSCSCQPRSVNRTARVVICMSRLRLASIWRVATPSWTGLGIWVRREALQAAHESP